MSWLDWDEEPFSQPGVKRANPPMKQSVESFFHIFSSTIQGMEDLEMIVLQGLCHEWRTVATNSCLWLVVSTQLDIQSPPYNARTKSVSLGDFHVIVWVITPESIGSLDTPGKLCQHLAAISHENSSHRGRRSRTRAGLETQSEPARLTSQVCAGQCGH